MQRRTASAAIAGCLTLAGAAGLGTPFGARAQGGLVEGVNYRTLSEPLPMVPGKVHVLEFFSYACPHCAEFEPALEAWVKALPKDVDFQRVPVPFMFNHENFQKLYYTLESLGQVDALQARVFHAVHQDHDRLDDPDKLVAFAEKNGIDKAKFLGIFSSFGVATKVRQASTLVERYQPRFVPTIGVQGRYTTDAALAGDNQKMLSVTDHLVQRVRAG